MKTLITAVLVMGLLASCANRGPESSCNGCQQTSIQDFEAQHEAQFTEAMQLTLEHLFKDKSKGIDDPEKIKAMRVLAKTDAAKSYAYTQIYAVSAKYCGSEVKKMLDLYETKAANIIALGHYYYQQGIEAKIGDRDLSQTGEALRAGLQEMTEQLAQTHQAANPQQLENKCREALFAMKSLIELYGNHGNG